MAVAADRTGAAGAFNHDVREEQVAIDHHRRHVRQVHRLLATAEQLRRVVYDARRRHRYLRREHQVAAAESARAEDVRTRQPPALVPEESQHDDYEAGGHCDPQRGAAGIERNFIHVRLDCGCRGGRLTFAPEAPWCQGFSGSRAARGLCAAPAQPRPGRSTP
jgi:hypothetical protein